MAVCSDEWLFAVMSGCLRVVSSDSELGILIIYPTGKWS